MHIKNYEEALFRASSLIQSSVFKDFLKLDINRCNFISSWLKDKNIPHSIVEIAGKKHIIVRYASKYYSSEFKTKTLTAHYDREENTQGANDNSAACFQLMNFAEKLLTEKKVHNIKIIFTDGEEAGAEGIVNQGAYSLGVGLKKLNMDKDDIFVFDMCGRGDTLVFSQSGIIGRDKIKTRGLEDLHRRSFSYAEKAGIKKKLSMLTAYSDNAGFIAAGLYAQVITILPESEASILFYNLPKNINCLSEAKSKTASHELADYVIKNKKPPKDSPFASIIPGTWQLMHTPADTFEKLTPEAFVLIEKYLSAII